MATLNGILKIEGTIEELNFYQKDGKTLVRKKGGVSKQRIMNDPNFERTRENGVEFAENVNAGKLLRMALATFIIFAKDRNLSSRLMGVMSKVKNLDLASARGLRKVANGIAAPDGKLHLKGFDFNHFAPMRTVLTAPYVLDLVSGKISFTNLIPKLHVRYPEHATHVSLQCGFLNLDLTTGVQDIAYSNIEVLPLDRTAVSPVLIPSGVPAGSGTQFYVLLVSFSQEVNGVQYPLKNHEFNSLSIVEVV